MQLRDSPNLSKVAFSAVLVGTLAVLYFHVISGLVGQWLHDPDYSHGFLVPVLAFWILWQQRRRVEQLPSAPSWWGVPIILGAMSLLIVGTLGAENYISRVSLLIVIAGLVINFYGWSHFRIALFAWLVLFLMIPLPAIIANRIVLPLQFLSSALATGFMDLCGIPVYREGNIIFLPSLTLEVAEACSGIRSLMAMITLAVAYGYLLESKPWRRVVLVLSAIPIAVVANSLRIMASGVLGQYWGRDKAEGFFHLFSGLVIFSFSFLLLWLLHTVLRRFTEKAHAESLA
jgi:exosortase